MKELILVVDDSKFTRTLLKAPLRRLGYRVNAVGEPREALDFVMQHNPGLIITDLRMPSLMDGLGFLKMLSLEAPGTPVMVYTSDPNPEQSVGEIGHKKLSFAKKPITPEVLAQKVERVLG